MFLPLLDVEVGVAEAAAADGIPVDAEDEAVGAEEELAVVETSLPFSRKRPLRFLQQSWPADWSLKPQQRLPSPHVVSGCTFAAASTPSSTAK